MSTTFKKHFFFNLQILLTFDLKYLRASVLENILNDLFQMFRSETCQNLKLALEVLLMAMERLVYNILNC